MATRTYDVPGPWDNDYESRNWLTHMRDEQVALSVLLDQSRAVPTGQLKGRILRFQKGDGYAFYRIESERPLKLAWIPFGDRWSISDAEMRGLRLQDVRNLDAQERSLDQLFGKSKERMRNDPV